MSAAKKPAKSPEELQTVLQKLIVQGRKDGMIRDSELRSHLEEMDLTAEKIEEIYDQFEAMNIQIVSAELDLDLDDAMADGDIDLADVEEEDLVDPVDLAAEYNLPLLAEIPMDPKLAALVDRGMIELMENDYMDKAAQTVIEKLGLSQE